MILFLRLCKSPFVVFKYGYAGGILRLSDLLLNFRLHLVEGDGMIVVVVHANIVLTRKQILQTRVVQPGIGPGTGMHMPEELPYIPVCTPIGQKGIVIENERLPCHAYAHLLRDVFKTPHITLTDAFHIMVAQNEEYLSVQAIENIIPLLAPAKTEITQVKYDAVDRDSLVPSAYQFLIHLRYARERAVAETENVLVMEMRVRGEPNFIRMKLAFQIHFV